MEANSTWVLTHLVRALHIPVTKRSIIYELETHPANNSLLAISQLLDNWLVPNASYSLNFKELVESEADTPFIAYISRKEFAIVTEFTETHAVLSNG